MVLVGFWINGPSKIGRFHQIGQNFAETLQFEDLAVKKFFFTRCIFLWEKKSWIGSKYIFQEYWEEEKNLKKWFATKSFSVFKKALFKPFKHTMTFFSANILFFLRSWKMHLIPSQNFISKKYARSKKERNFWQQGLQIAAFNQRFSQCW